MFSRYEARQYAAYGHDYNIQPATELLGILSSKLQVPWRYRLLSILTKLNKMSILVCTVECSHSAVVPFMTLPFVFQLPMFIISILPMGLSMAFVRPLAYLVEISAGMY
jgi:hypothetical protein